MAVTLAMLVLDPPLDRLAALFDYVSPVVGQIVVVVDDRTDRATMQTISDWPGVKAIAFRWVDDFAAARNAALPVATGDWILHLDPDELPSAAMLDFIGTVDRGEYRDEDWQGITYQAPRGYLFWTRTYSDGRLAEGHELDWHCRLFRREHGRWYKPVHEQVAIDDRDEGATRFGRLDEPHLVKAPAGAYLIHSHVSNAAKGALYSAIEEAARG